MELVAPNGKPSKLTPEQYRLVRTSAFKNWFGDWENSPETASKVIDENGEPLVVYHGSLKKFNVFKFTQKRDIGFLGGGFYFTNSKKMSLMYAQYRFVYDVFLNIKNPLIVKELKGEQPKINNNDGIIYSSEELLTLDKEELYSEYVAFNTNQIKLADGTNTTFDGNNPDIRYKDGGKTRPYVSDDFQIGYNGAYEHLIAPNGKPSNLTPEQYNLVRTSAFKKWFGDWENDTKNSSKVVDINGEPLVCYHGTNKKFNVFKKSKYKDWYFFTADIEEAKNFAENVGGSVIIQTFLNCRNPNPKKTNLQIAINKNLLPKEYDCHFQGGWDTSNFRIVVVKNSNQIKLADGTNTTFDSKNTDIRFDKGGEINKVTKLMYRDFFTRKFVNNISPNKLNVMRAGAEFSHESRGGDWYEFYAGQKSNFKKEKMSGVGGGKIHKKVISLKNPYYFNSTNSLSESEQTPMLYEKVTKKKFPAIMGTVWAEGKSEKYYSDAEKEIAEKLGKQGYDGVIFIQDGINNDIGKTYIGDIFHFKPELVRFNKGGNLNNFEYSIGGL